MAFENGKSGNVNGRPKGSQNEFTKQMKTVKETVLNVFNELQDDPKTELKQFAKEFPREFHAIAAKLIPTEVSANIEVVKRELPPFMKSNESES